MHQYGISQEKELISTYLAPLSPAPSKKRQTQSSTSSAKIYNCLRVSECV